MRVQVLGDLEVVLGDRVADLGGPKPRTLLALLVAAGGRAASPATRRRARNRC